MSEIPTPANGSAPANSSEAPVSTSVKALQTGAKTAKDTAKETAKAIEAAAAKVVENAIVAANAGADVAEENAETIEIAATEAVETATVAANASVAAAGDQAEAATTAARSNVETGLRTFEELARSWTRSFGLGGPRLEIAETSARSFRAVSDVSNALAQGAQDASKVWIELTQKAVRSNIEAVGQLTKVRSLPDLVALQGDYVRGSLEQAIAGGEEIARVSREAVRQAAQAIRPQA